MDTFSKISDITGENLIEKLSRETIRWIDLINIMGEEIRYIKRTTDKNITDISLKAPVQEILGEYIYQSEKLKILLQNHAKDITGIRDQEEIACEEFYIGVHHKLFRKIEDLLICFLNFKKKILHLLIQRSFSKVTAIQNQNKAESAPNLPPDPPEENPTIPQEDPPKSDPPEEIPGIPPEAPERDTPDIPGEPKPEFSVTF